MFIVFIRTAILYSLVVIVMRLMGKRQIGELQPYEFVITIMISDLAALPMQDTKFPLLLGIIPIITLLLMKTLLSQLQLKSQFARKIIDGEPTILIFKGKINFLGIKKQQINIDELTVNFLYYLLANHLAVVALKKVIVMLLYQRLQKKIAVVLHHIKNQCYLKY